jgi:glycosyltransferase involved in cell wall biosynthesis
LIHLKRVDLLIKACAGLIGKLNFHLHIVGDQLCLTKHVRFHGLLSQSAVADLLHDECGGAVVLEAMASGIPVIAAAWGGPADYIDANTGILIPPATPDIFVSQLADAILLLAKNSQLREEMGKRARQRIQQAYDWRAKAKGMLRIYEDVLSRNSSDKLQV